MTNQKFFIKYCDWRIYREQAVRAALPSSAIHFTRSLSSPAANQQFNISTHNNHI